MKPGRQPSCGSATNTVELCKIEGRIFLILFLEMTRKGISRESDGWRVERRKAGADK